MQETSIQPRTSRSNGFFVVFLLALVYMFASIDRALLSVLAEPIKGEFHLSDSELGSLTGFAFAIAYTLAGIPLGLLADRVSRTRLLGILVAIWSSLTLLTGFANSAFHLLLARVGVAASESGASPASMGIITDYFPKERRGLALSLFYMSTPIAVMVSFTVGSFVAAAFGWRTAFMFAALPGLVLASLIVMTIREPKRGHFDESPGGGAADQAATLRQAITVIGERRALLFLILGAICVVVSQAGLSAFSSPYLLRVHGLNLKTAGLVIGIAHGPAGILGILLGGLIADRMAKKSLHAAPRMVGTMMVLTSFFAVAAFLVPDWRATAVLMAVYNFLNYTYYGATFATYMTVAPVRMRGVLAGLLNVTMTLVGYGLGPPLAGTCSDIFASMGLDQPLRVAMVVTATFFAIGGFGFYAASRAIRRMVANGELV